MKKPAGSISCAGFGGLEGERLAYFSRDRSREAGENLGSDEFLDPIETSKTWSVYCNFGSGWGSDFWGMIRLVSMLGLEVFRRSVRYDYRFLGMGFGFGG